MQPLVKLLHYLMYRKMEEVYIMSFLVEKHYQTRLFSDEGNLADVNEPVREYPIIHFLEITDA